MYELFGLTGCDTVITPEIIRQHIHPEDREQAFNCIQEARLQLKPFDVEFRVVHPDGKVFWLFVSGQAYRENERSPSHVAGITMDITDRKQLEMELKELNQTLERRVAERTLELEQRNRELSSFAYVASHDLREPLRKVQTLASLLKADFGQLLDERGIHYLDRIEQAGARMSELLGDVLSFSRVLSSDEDRQVIRIDDIATLVLNDLEMAIQESASVIEVDAGVAIQANPSQIRQLLNHLVLNALKFRRKNVAPHIRIQATRIDAESSEQDPAAAGSICRIVVEDNGIGFDQKYESRIFEPFQRLHGRSYPGTGMGLAICRRIVERHNGTISVRSTPGSGTRMQIDLPVHPTANSIS